ncbi:isovaleryl-CoA dehydrogenase [Alteromonas sp. 1_MG-2023]|uniref:isovaleryl-CoA dehydrogenase n=1 Tax=Alteromonas sp. 1_MG-2023 TaxID=3062669 RepID=UPI0026E32837|nr:isovaleryl-CoA dehydrogenase [Alteromonas sp. 1_MG-2023]MDO6566412.1 isovaleryl-CoA dehydrogenase [Alteromonas sp. 1_MG-2023]
MSSSTISAPTFFKTHDVENQPTPLPAYNLWEQDALLKHAVLTNLTSPNADPTTAPNAKIETQLSTFGKVVGFELMEHGELANKNKPEFHPFDRYGRRIDDVAFHPSYHALMNAAMFGNVHNYSWQNESQQGAHVVRAALIFMQSQADAGTTCPLTMTHAAIPALRQAKDLPNYWVDKVVHGQYDSRTLAAEQKNGLSIGMGMTEKQGGSDVRRNTTTATKQQDGSYRIVGHKFFFSAPMCDGHLILAQTDAGLGCFLLPRVMPDGTLNEVRIQRLKDKLGDWSNASSEVEFQGATAHLIGEEGRGVRVIIDMVSLTRLDCMIGSSASMRQALVQAHHHVSNREAFGAKLISQPLMQNVIADLTLECTASLALTMRVARAVDASKTDLKEAALARIATAIGKYWICKRTPAFINEAQECLGGIGYVEENILPRLYRQAPLNSIWEGSGNVQCLDVLRALNKEPESKAALFDLLNSAKGKNAFYDIHLQSLIDSFEDTATLEIRSRIITEQTALAMQAALLINDVDNVMADTFCEARLGKQQGLVFGTLPATTPFEDIIERGALVLKSEEK